MVMAFNSDMKNHVFGADGSFESTWNHNKTMMNWMCALLMVAA